MTWRVAKALETLRAQVNSAHPNRSKISDGSIGDAAHSARTSDHNPGTDGVVRAIDITHDPDHGVDTWKLADIILKRQDPRLYYVISNSRIGSGPRGPQPGVWRKYTGANAHAHHVHVSVVGNASSHTAADRQMSDDPRPWALDAAGPAVPAPTPVAPKGVTADMRLRMVKAIMAYEDNPAASGKPIGITLVKGAPEIAGITQVSHPVEFARIKALIDAGNQAGARSAILNFYLDYTTPAQNWTDRAGLEFFLRDCILNRGPTGAAEILQMAVGVKIDHQIGPTTRGALAALDFDAALSKLRTAREKYEDKEYPSRRTSNQWAGMLNRWSKAVADARKFQKEQGAVPTDVKVTIAVGIFAAFVAWLSAHPILAVGAASLLVVGLIAIAVHFFKRNDQ